MYLRSYKRRFKPRNLQKLLKYTMTSTTIVNKDIVLIVSLVLSVVSLVLLFGVTWHFQSSLDLLQQQIEYDRELLLKLQGQINVSTIHACIDT